MNRTCAGVSPGSSLSVDLLAQIGAQSQTIFLTSVGQESDKNRTSGMGTRRLPWFSWKPIGLKRAVLDMPR